MPTVANTAADFSALAKNPATNEDKFFATYPRAAEILDRIEKSDRAARKAVSLRHAQTQELRDEIVTLRERRDAEKDPVKKTKLISRVSKLIAQQNELAAEKAMPQFMEVCKRYATRNRDVPHIELNPADFDNGKSFAECLVALNDAKLAVRQIAECHRTTAEAQADFKDHFWPRLQAQGEVDCGALCAGGDYDSAGKYRPHVVSKVFFPDVLEAATFNLASGEENQPVTGNIGITVRDSLAIMAWLDGDNGPMLKNFLRKIAEYNDKRRQMSMADKAAQLPAANAAVLRARRELEAAACREEADGKTIRRPGETPAEILLWIERAPAVAAKAAAKEVGSATVKKFPIESFDDPDAAQFEGDDE